MSTGTAPSLSQNVAPLDTGAHVTGIGWLKGTAAFGLGDGGVLLAKDGESHRVEAHPDAGVLVAASDGERFVTGGDDGRVAVTGADGSTKTLAESKGAWIDSLAVDDPNQAELLLRYLQLVTELTGSVLAAMLEAYGAPRAASTMSTLHEMWEAHMRERWEAEQRERWDAQQRERVSAEAKREVLTELLVEKFGELGPHDLERIGQADGAMLVVYLKRIVREDSIAAVLAPE